MLVVRPVWHGPPVHDGARRNRVSWNFGRLERVQVMPKLEFQGGEVEVRTPKPDELLLSAMQWVTRAREELLDDGHGPDSAACSALVHAMRALYELKGHV